ncbi:MAG TPA: TolC family protein [Polyangiaceae bacterium]
MNSTNMPRRSWALALMALSASSRGLAEETQAPNVLSERAVVVAALSHNPTLAAYASDWRRAQLLEEAEEHRHSFVLGLDASATRTRSPGLGPTGVSTPESRNYTGGADLSRHTALGTDLKLRLEGWRQTNQSTFFDSSTTPPSLLTYTMGPAYGTTVKFSLNQPLLRGAGRDVYYAERDAARASRASARSARDQAASQLLLDVLTAYWELNYDARSVEIQTRSLELARVQRDETAMRVTTGSVAAVDVLSFETTIATIEEDLATARAEAQKQLAELNRLIGDPDWTLRDVPETASTVPEPGRPADDVKQRTLAVSFELSQQRAAVELATVQARTADENYRPKLDVDAYVQAQGLGNKALGPMVDQLGGLGAVSAHVGLTYQAPLDGTQRNRERERALTAIQAAKLRLTAIEQRLSADVDKALTREQSSRNRIRLADATLAIAKQQLDAETQRFRTGSATALQVREAENTVRSAELRASRARTDWVEASVTLEHLSGRLLDRWTRGDAE